MQLKFQELKPIEEAQAEAEAFFNRPDVVAIRNEAYSLSLYLNDYQLGRTSWKRTYDAPHPSKEKRDKLRRIERDLLSTFAALLQRIEKFDCKD